MIIPIDFQNDGSAVGLQIDIRLPTDQITSVDTSDCFGDAFTGVTGCGRLDPPNDDIVRYAIATSDGTALPSGRLADLPVTISTNAANGFHPVDLLGNTSMAGRSDGTQIFEMTHTDGVLWVFGGESSSSSSTSSQSPTLFASSDFVSATPRPLSVGSFQIATELALLAANPDRLRVRLPDGHLVEVERKGFRASRGFVERLGTGQLVPDPGFAEDEREYFWRGAGKGVDVRFTVHRGFVNGSITTPGPDYVVDGPLGLLSIVEIDSDKLPPQDPLGGSAQGAKALPQAELPETGKGGPVELDVLVMYTDQARIDAGGQGALDVLIQQSMNNLNAAMSDSAIPNISFNLAGTGEVLGFEPSGITRENAFQDLNALRLHSGVRATRDSTSADLTVVLLRDTVDEEGTQQLRSCGTAFIQNQACSPADQLGEICTLGGAYEDFAYAWVSVQCANLANLNSFPHEVGHILGGEHERDPSCWDEPVCTSNPPDVASYLWSYAHPEPFRFVTLMGISNVADQVIQFSNPDVLIDGRPTGVEDSEDNARTIPLLAPVVEGFRGIDPDLIFGDGFE